ncbi:MAG: AIR synthase-related protein [archaeon]|nr:AIR synthase-related protein [archaeon]
MSDEKTITYADSGVNIELGDDASIILYNASKATWKNRKGMLGEIIVPFDDFSGIRYIDVSNLPEGTVMNLAFDGVGTKIEIAERMNNYLTIAYDLFAMVCDDAVVRGAEPVIIGSILDINSFGNNEINHIEKIHQFAEGYINAAKTANVAVVNGEVAELGDRVDGYGNFNSNWGAGLVWFANKGRLFTGREIETEDYCIGLYEPGFRSNGLSLVRKTFSTAYGDEWHNVDFNEKKLGDWVLTPSTIYSACVCSMFGGYDREPRVELHGVSHITGGGLPGKLGRVLKPSGLGADIDNPFTPGEALLHCQEKGNIPDHEAYRAFNMGQGMVIITPDPEEAIKIAEEFGIGAQVIGKVTEEKGIRIKSKGFFSEGEELVYNIEK